MNEEPPTPFDTVGDEPIEARIVAWVLGEASAFEAAELERLCEERPELLVFRRRMLALHCLLTEAEVSESDHSWKLPAEKRKALDEILGEAKVVTLDSQKELRVRHAGRRAFLAIAACVVLAVVVLQLVHPVWITKRQVFSPEKKVDFMPPGGGYGAGAGADNLADGEESTISGGLRSRDIAIITKPERLEMESQDKKSKETAAPPAANRPGTYKVDSAAMTASREPGLQQAARQSQLAKKTPESRVVPEAPSSPAESAVELTKPMPLIEAKGYASALEGRPDNKLELKGEIAQLPQAKSEVALETGTASRVSSRRGGQVASGAFDSRSMSGGRGGESFDDSLAVTGEGLTNGLRSGDQPIHRGSIDGLLNNPKSEPEAGRKAKSNEEFAAKPPVLTGKDSGVIHEQVPMAKTPDVFADESKLGGANTYTGAATIAGGDLKLDGAVESEKNQSSLAEREMIRRQKSVSESDVLLQEGRDAYAKGDYQQASEKYGRAIERLPDVPMLGERRESYKEHLVDADVALAIQNRKVGKYAEARKLLEGVENIDPDNVGAKRELSYLDDPIRTNPALTHEHVQNVDKVRRSLYTAEGNYNLGKYDDSKKAYEEVLKTDPQNSAARRGLERIATAKSDYYRAAYDHTRAELLTEVDRAWELSVPADGKKQDFDGLINHGLPIMGRLFSNKTAAVDPYSENSEYLFKGKDLSPKVEPAPALVDLMEEIPASENPYSTFSLNISDASFQLAKAALAKGERPDPASIKTEQFYNAVDYGDPAPASKEPVTATIEQSAHPVIPGRNLVRVALRTGSEGHSAAQPLRLTLLVDQSGSMVREDRRASMEHALAQLGVLLTKNDLVTVVGFSRTSRLLADGMTGDQAMKLGELVNQTASEGGTNLEEAMKVGGQMAERHQLAGAQNRIVLFTDGAANLGDANPARLAEQVKALRQKGIAFDIAGIGADGLNDRLLSELARNGNGRYYVVGDEKNNSFARQLAGAFRPAAENVKVQVNFNPQRVGKYKLIGFEKDRLKTEDFRNDAVDAAELAAEEAGVAIYQVEPLAEGTGELGEVSVRFRDAVSKEMVERSWTISYDSQASAFDRATPSMQLAGLSLLAAEKLKGGALADAIDFKQLSGPSAFVKQFYGDSPRVGDMLQVIEKLK